MNLNKIDKEIEDILSEINLQRMKELEQYQSLIIECMIDEEEIIEGIIKRICEKENPLVATLIAKKNYIMSDNLCHIIIEYIENDVQCSSYQGILSLLYMEKEDNLKRFINKISFKESEIVFIRTIKQLSKKSEYEEMLIFIKTLLKSIYTSQLREILNYIKGIEKYYIDYKDIIEEIILKLYESRSYNNLFYFVEALEITSLLPKILKEKTGVLVQKFYKDNSVGSLKLSLQMLLKDYDKVGAYTLWRYRLSLLDPNDITKHLLFESCLQLIIMTGKIDNETQKKLKNLGRVELHESNKESTRLLYECLKSCFDVNKPEMYHELIRLLGENHSFIYDKSSLNIPPMEMEESENENILEYLETLKESKGEKSVIDFYMNSYIRYCIDFENILNLLYGDKNRRMILTQNRFKDYSFYGVIKKNSDDSVVIFPRKIIYNKVFFVPQYVIDKYKVENIENNNIVFFKLQLYDSSTGYIKIENLRFKDKSIEQQHMKRQRKEMYKFEKYLKNIILKQKLDDKDIELIKELPSLNYKEIKEDKCMYSILFIECIYVLRRKPLYVKQFIEAINFSRNNIFQASDLHFTIHLKKHNILNEKNQYKVDETFSSLLESNDKEYILFVYMNSYLKHSISLQDFIESQVDITNDEVDLHNWFFDYNFSGKMSRISNTGKGLVKISNVYSKRIAQFKIIDEEYVSEEDIKNTRKLLSFKLRKYYTNRGKTCIQSINGDSWMELEDCMINISNKQSFTQDIKEKLESVSYFQMTKPTVGRYFRLFDKACKALQYKGEELYDFLVILGVNNRYRYENGQERIPQKSQKIEVEIINNKRLLNRIVKDQKILLDKFLYIYMNTYIRGSLPIHYALDTYIRRTKENFEEESLHFSRRAMKYHLYGQVIGKLKQDNSYIMNILLKNVNCEDEVKLLSYDGNISITKYHYFTLNNYDYKNRILYVDLLEEDC